MKIPENEIYWNCCASICLINTIVEYLKIDIEHYESLMKIQEILKEAQRFILKEESIKMQFSSIQLENNHIWNWLNYILKGTDIWNLIFHLGGNPYEILISHIPYSKFLYEENIENNMAYLCKINTLSKPEILIEKNNGKFLLVSAFSSSKEVMYYFKKSTWFVLGKQNNSTINFFPEMSLLYVKIDNELQKEYYDFAKEFSILNVNNYDAEYLTGYIESLLKCEAQVWNRYLEILGERHRIETDKANYENKRLSEDLSKVSAENGKQREEIAQLALQIQNLNKKLYEKEEEAEIIKEKNKNLENQINEKQREEIAQLALQIQNLNKKLYEKEGEAKTVKEKNKNLENQINDLIENSNRTNLGLNKKLYEKEGEAKIIKEKNKNLENQINDLIENSNQTNLGLNKKLYEKEEEAKIIKDKNKNLENQINDLIEKSRLIQIENEELRQNNHNLKLRAGERSQYFKNFKAKFESLQEMITDFENFENSISLENSQLNVESSLKQTDQLGLERGVSISTVNQNFLGSIFTDIKLGIPNIGNTCYLNSVLQILASTNELFELICLKKDNLSKALSKALTFIRLGNIESLIKSLKSEIDKEFPMFKNWDQQDSKELFLTLLEFFLDSASNPLFSICYTEKLPCRGCGRDNFVKRIENMLTIPSSENNIKKYLSKLKEPKQIQGSGLNCSYCNENKIFFTEINEIKYPPYIVFYLPKSENYERRSANFLQDLIELNGHTYCLYGVLCYYKSGGGGGHYTAFTNTGNQWVEYNDHAVEIKEFDEKNAYLAFYSIVS